MAFESNRLSCCPSLGWDLHTFGVLNADMSLVMQSNPFSSSDTSTGYLQDAIAELSDRSKRRRMLLFPQIQTTKDPDDLIRGYWNWDCHGDLSAKNGFFSQVNNFLSDDPLNSSLNSTSDRSVPSTETSRHEDEAFFEHENPSSSSSYKDTLTGAQDTKDTRGSRDPISSESPYRRKKVQMKVANPFALVKPGGIEGDVTLDNINERILMRPTKPVRHPVGEFACLPCVSADGPGLSGKTVVALTRIHTRGKGTVTIIRTRG